MPNTWFTADTHFGHDNIIKYCSRPFKTFYEMDEALISRFNEVVRRGDLVYHLGDLAWSSYDLQALFERLNTKSLHLILGNHDKHKLSEYQRWFQWVGDLKSITIDSQQVVLCHYPMRSWKSKGHGGFQLYGHCHGSLPGEGRQMDIGVDTNNFYPLAWEEVRAKLKDLPIWTESTKEDHHNVSGLV
jgi:calcineurin-like phosphoesterase family protein